MPFLKKEGVRRLLAAALLAAPLGLAAPASAADLYPGNGAAMSGESSDFYLPSPDILARCGLIKTVRKFGGGDYTSIKMAVDYMTTLSLSTNSCVVVIDSETYNDSMTIPAFSSNGHRLLILKDTGLTEGSPTVSPPALLQAFNITSDSVTIQGINVQQSQAAHALSISGHYAELSQSTVTISQGAYYGVYVNGGSTGTISEVFVSNTAGDALRFDGGARENRVTQSSLIASFTGKSAVSFANASSNTVTNSFIHNMMGYGSYFGLNSFFNSVTFSTVTADSGTSSPVYFGMGSGNYVSDSYIATLSGNGVYFGVSALLNRSTVAAAGGTGLYFAASGSTATYVNVSNSGGSAVNFSGTGNVVSFSTASCSFAGGYAAYFTMTYNQFLNSFAVNTAGTAVRLQTGGNYNSISGSTLAANTAGYYALDAFSAGYNTISGSYIYNPAGTAAYFAGSGTDNSISYSTMTSGAAGYLALNLAQAPNTRVASSYVQGAAAAELGSTSAGSSIGDSVFISSQSSSPGIMFGSAASPISLSSCTVAGGANSTAILIAGTNGTYNLSSNTVTGGRTGLYLPSSALTLNISSLTFQALSPGATAIDIAGGASSYSISSAAFNSANIAVNVNASLLAGGLISMTDSAGRRRGAVYENDPAGSVSWTPAPVLPSGCSLGFNVAKDGSADADTIQAAVRALPGTIAANACVVIRDTETYSEQVTVRNIENFGAYQVRIMADPTFVSSSPVVNPPVVSTAAFYLDNGSVTITGIDIVSTNTVKYGIWTSSPMITVSSVNIFSGGNIWTAGVWLSGKGALSYSTVSVQAADAVKLSGNGNSVSFSSVSAYSSGFNALYAGSSDSNTVTNSWISNPGGAALELFNGSDWNTLSYSTITSNYSFPALYITSSGSNTITDLYVSNVGGDGLAFETNADRNSISRSTVAVSAGSGSALYINFSSSNTVDGCVLSNSAGSGVKIYSGANRNYFSRSVISGATSSAFALYLSAASSNTVTGSFVSNLTGYGAYLESSSDFNAITLSTITSNAGPYAALYLLSSSGNTLAGNFISNPQGYGARFQSSANWNSVSQSTVTSGSPSYWALGVSGSSSNTFSGSLVTSPQGDAARFESGAAFNAVTQSSVTAYAAGKYGLFFTGASSNTVLESYVLGSTAVYVSASTGTLIAGSVLESVRADGCGLAAGQGSLNLSLATSTLRVGAQGSAVSLWEFNSGLISLTSNTVSGGWYGLNIATQGAGASLAVSSITFQSLAAGATAINFMSGYFVSTITAAAFNSANIDVNVNAVALDGYSRITMLADAGARNGSAYEKDPQRLVTWPDHPCEARTSYQSGNWSAGATWDTYLPPTGCSPVVVAAGHVVTVDNIYAVSSTAAVNGTVRASRVASSTWTVLGGKLEVNLNGTLDYGSAADPIAPAYRATLVLATGTVGGEHGLIVKDGGNFTVQGADKAPYAFATASLDPSATSLTVYGSTSTAGWAVGDAITIGPTAGSGTVAVSSRIITAVDHTAGANTVAWTVTEPLGTARTLTAGTPIVVGNLTRNVLVRSGEGPVAYVQNLARNATSFAVAYGEFAGLGLNTAGKYGVTFEGAQARGSVSSSTVRNGYTGLYLNGSSENALAGNNLCYNGADGLLLYSSQGNLVAGNLLYANGGYGAGQFYGADKNFLSGNRLFANTNRGIYIYNSAYNAYSGNSSYSNGSRGADIQGSYENDFAGNSFYSNAGEGIYLTGASNNLFTGDRVYSNAVGYYASNSVGTVFTEGWLGYGPEGAALKNAGGEILFAAGPGSETLTLKSSRVNPDTPLTTIGIDVPGASRVSYAQDGELGTLRVWGNYQVAGATLTLDASAPLYRASAAAPRLLRGSGHSASVTAVSDTNAVSQLITVRYDAGAANWRVEGSSSGLLGVFTGSITNQPFPVTGYQIKLTVTQGTPRDGDLLAFTLTGWSTDSGVQKRLLFGPAAPGFNSGRSKLEVAPTGGVLLRGSADGTANTLVDWLGAGSTYYTFVDSGAFTAEHSSFTNMDQGGIQLSGSADLVISSVTFDYLGFTSGTNAYITVRDRAAGVVVTSAAFDLSRASGSYSAYNVWVEGADAGLNLTFTEPAGPLWGERHDRDLNNRVTWINCGPVASAQSGDWSFADTWDAGNTPSACNSVTVNAGHTVTLDAMNAVSAAANIYGTVKASRLASSSWTLVGGDLTVQTRGTLDYGSESDTIPEAVTAHLVLANGASAGQYGLIVNDGGNFTVRGATKTPYAFAGASIGASDTSLSVYGSTSVAGWQPGDVITIGPTWNNGPGTTSTRTITNISGGSPYTVSWSGGALPSARTLMVDRPIIVGNLTRNVLVRSSGTVTSANTAYIKNLAQNATSFSLTSGEFAYLGANAAGKYGVTFEGALARGSVSSSTVRNGYRGAYLNSASSVTLAWNNFYANANSGISLNLSSSNTLTGNNSCANTSNGITVSGSHNLLTGNNSYSNSFYGIYLVGSPHNIMERNTAFSNLNAGIIVSGSSSTLAGNNSYLNSNAGILLSAPANNNLLCGNSAYNNTYGYNFVGASSNTLTGNSAYSNAYGLRVESSYGNIFAAGDLGYDAAGADLPNTTAEVYLLPGGPAENLVLKAARVNPAAAVSAAGMDQAGTSLLSFGQDADAGSVRLWGGYQVEGTTITLDYATQLYTSTNTAPKLMRGAGHYIYNVTPSDTDALSEVIKAVYNGASWTIEGSSSGVLAAAFVCAPGSDCGFPHAKVNFTLHAGPVAEAGDMLDFAVVAASKDSGVRKKLLFGPAAASYNYGRSKLEVAPTGGVVLRGKPDGSVNTLVDWLGAGATYYTFVSSGAFTAEHSSFTNMDQGGIQLSGSGSISVSSSTFDYLGFAAGTNAYITARTLNLSASLPNLAFGLSRSSAGFSAYNVWVEGDDTKLGLLLRKAQDSLGPLWGQAYERDLNGRVDWADDLPAIPGCGAGVTVRKNGSGYYTGIQQAVDALNHNLGADTCVVIRDTGTYSEQVTVQGFTGNGYRLRIMADPTFTSSAPVVTPPVGAEAAFKILSASVSVQGVNIVSTNSVAYGIFSYEPDTVVSSVNIVSAGNITASAITVSSWSLVENSSITVQAAYGLRLENGGNNTVRNSTFTCDSPSQNALYLFSASTNTLSGLYVSNPKGHSLYVYNNSNNNTIAGSTMTAGDASYFALLLYSASSNTIEGSVISNTASNAVYFAAGSSTNTVRNSVITAGGVASRAFWITGGSSSNTITDSAISNGDGIALYLDSGVNNTFVERSTITNNSASLSALSLNGASSGTVRDSYIANPGGYGAVFATASDYNSVIRSTIASASSGAHALNLNSASHNRFDSDYLSNPAGYGVSFYSGSNFNSIENSTITSNGPGLQALYLSGSSSNTVSGSVISHQAGRGVFIGAGSDHNAILRSRIISDYAGYSALYIFGASSNTVLDSYVQGSTAAHISASTGTVLGGSVFSSDWGDGVGLSLSSGSVGLRLSTSSVSGGDTGLYLGPGNSDLIKLSSNVVGGGRYGLNIAPQSGTLAVSSMTFAALTPGATAINFLGGQFISTFSSVGFNASGIHVNVNGSALLPGSRVTMLHDYGPKGGPLFEKDPTGYVYWDLPGLCNTGVSVAQDGSANFASIQAAVDAIPATLSTNTCVVIRDTQTYNQQVTVEHFLNAGYRLMIIADPAFASSAPAVSPPPGAAAAFRIINASVTVQGINILPASALDYGIWSSSDNVTISSVNLVSGGYITKAGISVSTFSRVEYLSVTVENVVGLRLQGGYNSVVQSTLAASGFAYPAFLAETGSSSTITGSYIYNPGGTAARFDNGAVHNTVSLSTMASNTSGHAALDLAGSTSNVINNSYLFNAAGRGLWLSQRSDFNRIAQCVITAGTEGALYAETSSSNTVSDSRLDSSGHTAEFYLNSDGNSVSRSTVASTGVSYSALYFYTASTNTVSDSYIYNSGGVALDMYSGANYNSVLRSTAASSGAGGYGLLLTNVSSNTVLDSYLAGLSGAMVSNSVGTVIGGSRLASPVIGGNGLVLNGASLGLALSSSSVAGGPQGYGIYLADGNYGAVRLSTVAVNGGKVGLHFGAQGAGAVVSVDSITFQGLAPGATAVNFAAATVVSTFNGAAFYGPGLAANFYASDLLPGSSIYVRLPSGTEADQSLAKDPNGAVQWPWPASLLPTSVSGNGISLWYLLNGASGYAVLASSSPDFTAAASSGTTDAGVSALTAAGLLYNTTYYIKAGALWDRSTYYNPVYVSTVTNIESPATVYFDHVGSTLIVVSAYAPGPGLTGLERGVSGVNIALNGSYGVWGSSGNYWNAKQPMITQRAFLAVGAIGGKLYAVGGYNGARLKVTEEYDPASDTWLVKAPMPTARQGLAAGVVGGRLYAVGGTLDGSTPLGVNEEYDPVADTWTVRAPLSTPRMDLAAGVIGGRLYAVGGVGGSWSGVTEEYDPAADTWTVRNPMFSARNNFALGAIGGKLYAAGGFDGVSALAATEAYDPATGDWTPKAALPAARSLMAAAVLGGKLYTLGGDSDQRANEVYDPQADTWTVRAAMSAGGYGLAAGAVNGKLYAVGGVSGSYTAAADAYIAAVSRVYTGLQPNALYSFKAKARSQDGMETADSAGISTYTLAAAALSGTGTTFAEVYSSSVTVYWSSGTDAGGYNATQGAYLLQASTAANFTGALVSSFTADNSQAVLRPLSSNSTYYFRLQAYNAGGMTDYSWLVLGSTVTQAIVPSAAAAPFSAVLFDGMTVHWGTNGNSDGTGYELNYSSYSDFTQSVGVTYTVGETSPTLSGVLQPNTTYYARVAAINYAGARTAYYEVGSTVTAMTPPSDILFMGVSSNTIVTLSTAAAGFPNLALRLSGLDRAIDGAYAGWTQDATAVFGSLAPNTLYGFKAKARNQLGLETAESPVVSTYTLAAVSAPQSGPLFEGVTPTLATVNWSSGTAASGFNAAGARYRLEVSQIFDFSLGFSSQETTALTAAMGGLWPNTTHYFRVLPYNSVNVPGTQWLELGSTSTLTNQAGGTAVPEVFPTSVTVTWSSLPLALSSGTCEGYRVEASTMADFGGLIRSSVTAVPSASSLTVESLFADTTYYLRVGPLNWNGAANYAAAVSTATPPENIVPTIVDNELTTDYTWYGAPTRAYNVDFHDTGGSALENFQVRAATAPLQAGLVTLDWHDLATALNVDDYTGDWTFDDPGWALLQDGTNYVSVRVYDGSGNSAETSDVFVVFKDTTPPAIVTSYADAVWRSTYGFVMDLTFIDPHSRLDTAEAGIWSGPGRTGTELSPWSSVVVGAGTDWQDVPLPMAQAVWDLLQSGTNYVSLRAWDYSLPVNTGTVTDAFVVLKDTVAPEAINSLTAVSGSTFSATVRFFGPLEYPSGIAEFAVQYASYTVAWATSSVAGSSHVYISTSGVNYLSEQAAEITGLLPNATYYFRAWARDQAGNWSGGPNYDAVSTLAEKPVYAGLPQVYTSSASVAWLPGVDAAIFRVDASTQSGFIFAVYSSATVVPSATSLYVEGLAPNTTYYLRPVSLNWAGVPNYGNVYAESTFALQPASAAVYAAVSSVAITVEWLSNGNGPETRYLTEISSDNFTSVLSSVQVTAPDQGPYSLPFGSLQPNTTYWFRVMTQGNRSDASAWLSLGSTVTAPAPPVLTGYTFWASSASVNWTSNGNGAGTLYQCDLSTSASFTGVLVSSAELDALAFNMGPITPNTTYYLRLRAVSNFSGMNSAYVNASALTLALPPDSVGAWTIGPNNIGAYWDASRNPGVSGFPAWSGGAGLPAALYGHSGAIAGDMAFITGGYDGASYKKAVWYAPLSADGTLGAWTQVRDMPAARYAHTSIAMRGRLYVIGGYDGSSARAEVWSAPISSYGALGEWATEAPLPLAAYAHGLGVGANTLYVVGGYNSGALEKVWYSRVNADGSLDGWNSGPDLLPAVYALAAVVGSGSAGPSLYAIGGYDGVSAKSAVWKAAINGDGTLAAWAAEAPLTSAVYGHAAAFVPGGIAVSGGNGGTLARTGTLLGRLNADGTLAGWSAGGSLSAARQAHVMFARGSRLTALGGYDGGAAKADGEYTTLAGTEYRLLLSGAGSGQTPWMVSGDHDFGALAPNSYYTLRPAARNYSGIEAVSAAAFSTCTYAAQPSSAAVTGVFISSMQANWLAKDNPAGTLYEAQLSSDAAHTQLAFTSVTANAFASFTGLKDDYAYYARVRAVNQEGVATAWTGLGSGVTRADPSLDFTAPVITDNQAGDDSWRNSGGTLYDVDFADAGGSYLQNFRVRASTTLGAGPYSPDWTDVAVNLDAPGYTAGWALPAGFFELLPPGTSYISISAQDGNSNTAFKADAFYVLKDTAAPVITDLQGGEGFWRLSDSGALYNVDFADDVSGLAGAEYSASPNPGSGDAAALAWTPVAAVPAGLKSYAQDWALDFSGLANDATNYISVRAWDLAGNTVAVSGIDVFKVLKYVSGPEIGMTAPDAAYLPALAAVTGTASDARSQTASAVELSIKDAGAGKYWDGAAFLSASPKWFAAAGTYAWTYAPGIAWAEGGAYQLVARASDTAGNYSLTYATRAFTFDSLPPVIGPLVPADGASVNAAASISGTASDVSGLASLSLMFKRVADGKWWDFAAGTWTVSGSSAAVGPAAGWSYTPSELLRASLETGASYYYTLAAADNAVPSSSVVFGVYGSTFGFLDDTAPAAIAGLFASTGNAPGNISLSWSAPGDDGASGMILYGQYRVQYSTMADAVFSTASAQVIEDFTAVSAGSARSKELTGLTAGQTYYLRVWTRDDAFNWSALSNAATAQAAPYPDRIGGHVMKVSSEGITGVLVEAFDAAGLLKGSAYTVGDGSGTYAITGLAAGSYRLQATWEADDIISSVGSEGFALGASNADFTLAINYELASIGGELTAYRLSVLRYRAKGGKPLAAAQVELYQRGRLTATAPVDAAGRFLIKNLLPGKYVLRVPDGQGGMKELSVRVKAGEALQISPLGDLLKAGRAYVYPNPAGRLATFHVESDQAPITKQVAVFDVTGRLVAELNDSSFVNRNGGWEADWNIPSKIASGVYVYRIRVRFEATGETKKIVKKFAIVK